MGNNDFNFKISAFLKDLIGRELITDEFVAVFELVKNSFDAHASNVKIIFEDNYDSKKAKIIIRDDGLGMNIHDIKDKWLFVAHSDKRDKTEYRDDYRNKIQHERIFAGAKGVGRFSCDRLGKYLNLISLKENDDYRIEKITIDWTKFENNSYDEFINIPIEHSVLNSTEYENFKHGTILEISGLRDTWTRERIQKLKYSLEKLINPMQENDAEHFSIEIIAQEELVKDSREQEPRKVINGIIKNQVFESLGLKTTQITVSVSEDGSLITTTLNDRGFFIYDLKEKNIYDNLHNIKITLFVLNRAGKLNFKKIMGINSVEYGSVFMYKNGFRIYPFGEEGDDSFKIDRRKQQGVYRYIGTRDLIGRIEITGEQPELKETTSRDGGIIKTDAYLQLEDLLKTKALVRLENYTINTIKWGNDVFDKETGELIQSELQPEDVKTQIVDIITSLTKAKDVIDITYNDNFLKIYEKQQEKSANQLIKNFTRMAANSNNEDLVKKAKEIEKSVNELRKAKEEAENENEETQKLNRKLEKKSAQITTENLFLLSDVNQDVKQLQCLQHHITHISSYIKEISIRLVDAINANEKEKSLSYVKQIILENEKIASVSNFVSKAKFDTKSNKIQKDLIVFINEYITNVCAIANKDITFHVTTVLFNYEIKFSPVEIVIILDSLISNSKKARATNIYLDWELAEKNIKLHFRDDGKGISDDDLQRIFEYRFTTTGGGGLGLYHVNDILSKMNGAIVANNKIKGAEFIINFGIGNK